MQVNVKQGHVLPFVCCFANTENNLFADHEGGYMELHKNIEENKQGAKTD